MLIIPPSIFRRRRGRVKPAPLPPLAELTIISVTISPVVDTQLILTFSGAIAWNGIDLPGAFQVFTHDGFMDGCIGVLAVGGNWIELEFNGGVDPGAAWEVIGAMAGISPMVAWPQAGVVS